MLATQTLVQAKDKNMRVQVNGALGLGVTSKVSAPLLIIKRKTASFFFVFFFLMPASFFFRLRLLGLFL